MTETQPRGANDTPPGDGSDLIGRTEFALRLGVDVRTFTRMVQRGELPKPCIGSGGRPRWLWSFVVKFLEKRHQRQAGLARRTRQKLEELEPRFERRH